MTRSKLGLLGLLICFLGHARCVEVSVKAGDSFNTILKQHKVSSTSIDQINASVRYTPILSKLKPEDKIELHLSSDRNLVTAYITQNKSRYVLNKSNQLFHSSKIVKDPEVKIVSLSHNEAPETEAQIWIHRAVKTVFPDYKEGVVLAAIKNNKIIALKAVSGDDTQYAFLQETSGFPVYTDHTGTIITPAISRMPLEHFWISSRFNPQRLHPITKKIRPHNGVDLSGPINTQIWAAADGVVTHKSSDTLFGNLLIIKHSNGVETLYGHMNKFHDNIQEGSHVSAYETIGYVGSTGISTGYHLHFEIRINGTPYDPLTTELPHPKEVPSVDLPYYF